MLAVLLVMAMPLQAPRPAQRPPVRVEVPAALPPVLRSPPVLRYYYAPSYAPAIRYAVPPWRAAPAPYPFRGGAACPPGGT